jgi:ketosteroid isomerase-like protein
MKKYLFIALLPLLALACSQPAETEPVEEPTQEMDMDALKAEIQAMEDAYAAAENAGDIDGILAYYADDAVNMPNEEPIVVGKEAIRNRLSDEMAEAESEGKERGTITFKLEQLYADGDLLVEAGSSEYTSPDGKVSTGKYVSIFEKRDGKYVCVRDIWNEDSDDDDDDDMNEDEM